MAAAPHQPPPLTLRSCRLRRPLAFAVAACIPSCPRVVDPRAHHAAEARATPLPSARPSLAPLLLSVCAAHAAQCYIHDGSVETARRIVRHEGWRALWRGTGPTLAMAVPSVAVYLPVYDALQARLVEAGAPHAAPALAGAAARALAVFGVGALSFSF